jgi:hypothetical protein
MQTAGWWVHEEDVLLSESACPTHRPQKPRRVEKLDSKIGKADQCSPKARVEGEVSLQSGHGHKGVCWVKTYVM